MKNSEAKVETIVKLKKCPFCGYDGERKTLGFRPELSTQFDEKVASCSNKKCDAHYFLFSIETWQNREE